MFGEDWNGGPYHMGICPECGQYNRSTYDGLCNDCEEETSMPCPICGQAAHRDDLAKHGMCWDCVDAAAERFAEKVLDQIEYQQLM